MSEIQIDTNKLKKYAGKLIPDVEIEMELVKLYRYCYNRNNDPIKTFTNIYLQYVYKDTKDRDITDVDTFMPMNVYITKLYNFYSILEMLILRATTPDFNNITFDRLEDNIAYYKVI